MALEIGTERGSKKAKSAAKRDFVKNVTNSGPKKIRRGYRAGLRTPQLYRRRPRPASAVTPPIHPPATVRITHDSR